MERIFLKKKSFPAIIVQLPQKPAFHPSLGAHCRSGNSGVPGRATSPVVRKCAHENKRVLRKQKPQHAPACKHPGYKSGRALLFTVLNTKNLYLIGSGILQQSAVQFLFRAQAKCLQFSDRSKLFYHLCALQEFFPIQP